jgi:putative oxidoreductase
VIGAVDGSVLDPEGLDLGLFVLRVVVGATIAAHGYNHIFRGGKIAGTARWFESLGMRPGVVHAWLASATELAAGVSLVLGFLTPLGAAGVAGTMAVAFVTNHRKNGFFIFRPGEGWEYVNVLMLAGVALGATGPGRWSVDEALSLDWVAGTSGLAIAAGGGLGGAALLLATCWRPPAPAGEPAAG